MNILKKITPSLLILVTNLIITQAFAANNDTPNSAVDVRDLSLDVETITEGLYVLMGKRAIGNVLVSIGEDGTYLIDDQFEDSEPEIQNAIENLGGSTPTFIINSHYHHDHAGGNAPFSESGAIIAAHDNTRKLLAKGTEIPLLDLLVPPAPTHSLPTITFAEEMKLHLNDNQLQLTHIPNAHTESDIIIHLIESNVIHVGDIWNYTGNYPFIDLAHGGSLAGMIEGQKAIADLADFDTVIVPGHGPLANKVELANYTSILSEIFENLTEHARQGDDLETVITANAASKIHEFTTGIVNEAMWLGIVYPKIVESI